MISSSKVGLTPAAGSSSKIACGSAIRMRASSRSLRWPPESARAGSLSSRDSMTKSMRALAFSTARFSSRGDAAGPQKVHPQTFPSLILSAGQNVFKDRHFGEGTGNLEGAANAESDAAFRTRRRDIDAGDTDRAGGRPQASGDEIEQRCLSRAVRTDQSGSFRRDEARSTCHRRRACRRIALTRARALDQRQPDRPDRAVCQSRLRRCGGWCFDQINLIRNL